MNKEAIWFVVQLIAAYVGLILVSIVVVVWCINSAYRTIADSEPRNDTKESDS